MLAPSVSAPHAAPASLRQRLYIIIFEAETRAGKAFDVALLWLILASILVVMLDSVPSIGATHGNVLRAIEWTLTGLFALEYAARLYCARRRLRYALSFFGIVDLLALLPTIVSLVWPGAQSLLVIRALRLIRVFRVLKVVRMLGEAHVLGQALRASLPKIAVFLGVVIIVVVITGTAMHVIEGADSGFSSVPQSMYWAIVTMTTVGYGDIAPQTALGQGVAALLMVVGYGVLAVPTGIVSAELVGRAPGREELHCRACGTDSHLPASTFCRVCGTALR